VIASAPGARLYVDARASSNLVEVNGKRLDFAWLRVGDLLKVGDTTLRVGGEQSPRSATAIRRAAILIGGLVVAAGLFVLLVVKLTSESGGSGEAAFLSGLKQDSGADIRSESVAGLPQGVPTPKSSKAVLSITKDGVTLAEWVLDVEMGVARRDLAQQFTQAGYQLRPWADADSLLFVGNGRWALLSVSPAGTTTSVQIITGTGDRPQ
jgi:hypothetical protein